ncbi:MAG: hypothetical protein WA001_00515, partial [Patescibacteria group bacterium]
DDQFLHFTANVPGYSSFAITCAKGELNAIAAEPTQIATNSTEGSNASTIANKTEGSNVGTIANKIAEESKKAPGFSTIGGIVCLFCILLYRNKKGR